MAIRPLIIWNKDIISYPEAFLKGVFGGLGAHTFRNPVLLMHKRIMYGMMMGAVKG